MKIFLLVWAIPAVVTALICSYENYRSFKKFRPDGLIDYFLIVVIPWLTVLLWAVIKIMSKFKRYR